MAAALAVASHAGAAEAVSYARSGDRVTFKLDTGAAEIEWLTGSSFRFRQAFAGSLPRMRPDEREPVNPTVSEVRGELVFTTRYVTVSVRKRGLAVRARKADGTLVFEDLRPPEYVDGAVRLERAAASGISLYGLGPRADAALDARGKVVRAGVPFLLSTAGYGEYFSTPAAYAFDMAHADRYRVEARGPGLLDYIFCYGPTPKEVFEDLYTAGIEIPAPPPAPAEPAWDGLRAALLRVLHGSLSGLTAPEFDEAAFRSAPPDVREAARQLAGLLSPGVRPELGPYFTAYRQEVRDRGLAPVRAMPYQFPNDPEAARHSGQFMFGDELLASPVLAPGGRRQVYLPRGIWTRLDTNEVHNGRQSIEIETRDAALFARNGSIVPLERAGSIELHYFPRLGGEFFLFERDSADYSQMHAAPAGDILRLQIESVREREYCWVVRHLDRPARVEFEGREYAEVAGRPELRHETWFHDAASRSLYVRVRVAAGEDRIVNVIGRE